MTDKQWPDFRPSTWRSKEDGRIVKGIRVSTRRARIFIPHDQLIELANMAADIYEENSQ